MIRTFNRLFQGRSFHLKWRHQFSSSSKQDTSKIIDVLRLEQDTAGFFINFPGRTMPLGFELRVSEAQIDLLQNHGFGEIHFFSKDGIPFAASTPLQIILEEDFYINLEGQSFYIANTNNSANLQLGISTERVQTHLSQGLLRDICTVAGHSIEQQRVLHDFVGEVVAHLEQDVKETIDKSYLNLITRNVLNQMAIRNNKRVTQLDALIAIVRKRLEKDLITQKDLEDNYVKKKMNTFFKRFFSVVAMQIALIQYGTYIFISWDFMEPITCLLGISDAIIAYGYWLSVNHKYDYETLALRKSNSLRKSSRYNKEIDQTDMFARNDLLDYLKRQKIYHSTTLPELIKLFASKEDILQQIHAQPISS